MKRVFVVAMVLLSFSPADAKAETTLSGYAPPGVWGRWFDLPGHIGSVGYELSYSAVGDTSVVAEVEYVDGNGVLVTKGFSGFIHFKTGPFVGAPRVRFSGTPFGSAVRLRVRP